MTDIDVPLDGFDQAPDVTTTDEAAPDRSARIVEEDAGVSATVYTVQAGHRLERDGVMLEAGTTVQFRPGESAADLLAAGVIA